MAWKQEECGGLPSRSKGVYPTCMAFKVIWESVIAFRRLYAFRILAYVTWTYEPQCGELHFILCVPLLITQNGSRVGKASYWLCAWVMILESQEFPVAPIPQSMKMTCRTNSWLKFGKAWDILMLWWKNLVNVPNSENWMPVWKAKTAGIGQDCSNLMLLVQ